MVRELIQNAYDAIQWHEQVDSKLAPSIVIRFSSSGQWFEVSDNGIGMDRRDFEESLLKVGRDKLEALGLDSPPGEQVAFFGIGVLSVFLIADRFEVSSRKLQSDQGFRSIIKGLQEEIEVADEDRDSTGTSVKVHVSPDRNFSVSQVPEAVRRYVRHVDFVRIEDVDQNTSERVDETWATSELISVRELQPDDMIRAARMGFSPGLKQPGVINNAVTLGNAGFLVEETALDALPFPPVGYSGEVDLHANALNIVMARERFQRDEKWAEFGQTLRAAFQAHAVEELINGSLSEAAVGTDPGARNHLLIWFHVASGQQLEDLKNPLADRIRTSVRFALSERDPSTLARIAGRLTKARKIYVRRVGATAQRSRHIDDEGLPIQLVEEIRDSVRVGALIAKGFPVIEATTISYTQQTSGGASTAQVDEVGIIQSIVDPEGISVLDISQAPPEDMSLEGMDQLPVIRSVLNVGSDLRFARVQDSNRRVVTDPSGVKYLNTNNPTIRRLLATIPSAVSNPLRRRLLQIYLGLEDFRLPETREFVIDLLEHPDLASLAVPETAVLSREAVRKAVEQLLKEYEEPEP